MSQRRRRPPRCNGQIPVGRSGARSHSRGHCSGSRSSIQSTWIHSWLGIKGTCSLGYSKPVPCPASVKLCTRVSESASVDSGSASVTAEHPRECSRIFISLSAAVTHLSFGRGARGGEGISYKGGEKGSLMSFLWWSQTTFCRHKALLEKMGLLPCTMKN